MDVSRLVSSDWAPDVFAKAYADVLLLKSATPLRPKDKIRGVYVEGVVESTEATTNAVRALPVYAVPSDPTSQELLNPTELVLLSYVALPKETVLLAFPDLSVQLLTEVVLPDWKLKDVASFASSHNLHPAISVGLNWGRVGPPFLDGW